MDLLLRSKPVYRKYLYFFFFSDLLFCVDFLVVYKIGLIRKLRLISKFMISHTGQQIMCNISKSKGNQTMKLGRLIEHNMRNIFLEKSYHKCGGEASSIFFYKKSKLSVSLDRQSEMLLISFYCMSKSKYIKTKVLTTCFYLA